MNDRKLIEAPSARPRHGGHIDADRARRTATAARPGFDAIALLQSIVGHGHGHRGRRAIVWRQHRRKYRRADSVAAAGDLKRKLGGKRVHARAAGALPLRPYQAEMAATIPAGVPVIIVSPLLSAVRHIASHIRDKVFRRSYVVFETGDHHWMDLRLRRGTDRDAVAVSALYLSARKAAKATIPMTAHTDDEVRRWIAEWVVAHTELWVAEDDGGALVGLLVLDEDWLEQLYVEPTLTGCGIGSELIGLAKRTRPKGLRLWTFESNLGAQRFYERHGFRPMERTAGDNEEGAPDILYVWDAS